MTPTPVRPPRLRPALRRIAAALVVGIALSLSTLPAASDDEPLYLPDFDIQRFDGGYIGSAELAGHVVLVDLWTSACEPCLAAMPRYQALYDAFAPRGFRILSLNLDDDPRAARDVLATQTVSFPVAPDAGGEIALALGMRALPTAWLVGCDGRVRERWVAYHEPVDDAIRRRLDALLAERTCTAPVTPDAPDDVPAETPDAPDAAAPAASDDIDTATPAPPDPTQP